MRRPRDFFRASKPPFRLIFFFALLCLLAPWRLCVSASYADNWFRWRGPEQNGVSSEKDLPDRWSPKGGPSSNLVWKQPFGGRSTPIILNGRVYIINKAGEGVKEQERVMCFDAKTGKVLWQYRFNVFFTDIVEARVGWTNLAADPETGNIYASGVQGLFFCFDKDGKVLWSHSLTESYGRVSGYGGRVNSPTVDGDLVIIGMPNASWGDQGRTGDRYLAMDKRTGKPIWWSTIPGEIRGTYYSSPVVVVINGERLLITGTSGGGIHALKVRTGEHVWGYQVGAKAINSSPVVQGTRVYVGHGEENLDTTVQGRIVCLDAAKVKDGKPALVWKRDGITVKFPSPVIHGGRIYFCNEGGKMFCLDANTGDLHWTFRYGTSGAGSPVWADGKIYIAEAGPNFCILKPEEKRCRKLQCVHLRSADEMSSVEINGSPAVADGRIYFSSSEETYCLGKPEWNHQTAPVAPQPQEAKADPDARPAHLLVVPADVVLKAGGRTRFKVRAYDDKGRFLREVNAEWSLPRPPLPMGAKAQPPALKGTITSKGRLQVSKKVPAQQGIVLAKAAGLTATARVRVPPALPYRQDFAKIPVGALPAGWVNAAGKFVVVELDGKKVLKKTNINPNPALARARTYIGKPTLKNYTIQADVMGTLKNNELPDMGVCANRYTLFLDGNKQLVRITSWSALPRVDESRKFEWKPKTWYRMKFTVKVNEDNALVRGKVWPRDEQEPADWTIEFTDPVPNREGSPALYGYSTAILDPKEGGSEVYFANVKVTSNKKR
jgi:outer membrane protein assembly factor BamB